MLNLVRSIFKFSANYQIELRGSMHFALSILSSFITKYSKSLSIQHCIQGERHCTRKNSARSRSRDRVFATLSRRLCHLRMAALCVMAGEHRYLNARLNVSKRVFLSAMCLYAHVLLVTPFKTRKSYLTNKMIVGFYNQTCKFLILFYWPSHIDKPCNHF